MSASILKRSLAIVEEDLIENKKKCSSKKSTKNSKNWNFEEIQEQKQQDAIMELLPKNQRLTTVVTVKRGKKDRLELMQRPVKFTLEEAKKNLKENRNKFEENVQKLLTLSSIKLDQNIAETILARATKGHYVIPEQKKSIDEPTAFTEQDFKAFEKEYFES